MKGSGGFQRVETSMLDLAYLDTGPGDGAPVVLLHGFPYDVNAYQDVAPGLAAEGCRVITPYLRGYGPTRFLSPDIFRSGEQAALAHDLSELIESLELDRTILVGYDWGGRAACLTAAVWPGLVRGLVTVGGYNIFGPPDPEALLPPKMEHALWYQHYLNRNDAHWRFSAQRDDFCRYLWQAWSPPWDFDEATFTASAKSFDNPDFIDVVIHSYRHRAGNAPGDPALATLASRAEQRPDISVPTFVLHGDAGLVPPVASESRDRFTGPWKRRIVPGVGHNLPQEAPAEVIRAVTWLLSQ